VISLRCRVGQSHEGRDGGKRGSTFETSIDDCRPLEMRSKLLHSCFGQRCHVDVLEMVEEGSGDREVGGSQCYILNKVGGLQQCNVKV